MNKTNVPTERELFENWWFNSDQFEYGQTDSAWNAWQARAALQDAAVPELFYIGT
jgi:hypothetical protein